MKNYDHKKIEKKWQTDWEKKKIYQAVNNSKKKKFYSLIEFPYPSGAGLHVGHVRSNTAMDIISRKRRMQGYNVLYPIGWDAFGLPTENYAIKTGIPPAKVTKQNTDTFRKQLKSFGFSFNWTREVNTTDPTYYKWTQWIFLQMYKKGLAYKLEMPINWCPNCKIGLANEEVINGQCERCGAETERRLKKQWMLGITKYADRLDKDLDLVDYPENIKAQQRNWIGRSEGSEIEFKIKEFGEKDKIVILHGRNGTSKNYFYPWLKKELEKTGATVFLPDLPNTNEPNDEEQANYVMKNISLDQNTTIITHSFGGIVAMRILERGIKIKGLIQFSTPLSGKFLDGKIRKSVTEAAQKGFDFEKIKKQANYFKVIFDSSDNIVPKKDQEILAKNLETFPQAIDAKETHFCAKEEPEMIDAILSKIKVFTTRADTLFGATYVVLAPEHELVQKLNFENKKEVEHYIKLVKSKTDIERTDEKKEKTGIELKGVKAINPTNSEEIPVWVADYVLAGYGTGAVMAVPAHDERDFEFAKKYKLNIKQVIMPCAEDDINPPRDGFDEIKRNTVIVFLKDKQTGKYALLDWHDSLAGIVTGVMGGIEESQTPEEAALTEIKEEVALTGVKIVKKLNWITSAKYCASHKNQNRCAVSHVYLAEVDDISNQGVISEDENKIHTLVWIDEEEVLNKITPNHQKFIWKQLFNETSLVDDGILMNSGKFNNLTSGEARNKITEFVGGKIVTKYKLRDWVFSRQRYWGEPIPLVFCEKCGWVPVPEKELPVKLPEVKNYSLTETGESPLAKISKWVNTKCPKCKGKATRETDTMPNWAGSSWYYLRYTDPKNKKEFANKKILKYWTPVDWYNGGMEHVTLHLLYSRFWHKFLYDLKLVPTKEPYKKRTAHGMILAANGEKMSKSRGNVINPDDIIKLYGADTLRLYEMFIGPFADTVAWNDDSIIGPRRFIEKVWRISEKVSKNKSEDSVIKLIHKTIKKVGEDIEEMRFNTAVSAMMILATELEKAEKINIKDFKNFLQILAPFAPHVAEELWTNLGEKKSIHTSDWPKYNKNLIKDDEIKIAIQVNGKVRAEMMIQVDETEEKIKEKALKIEQVLKFIENKEIRKVIYVKSRLVNIVV